MKQAYQKNSGHKVALLLAVLAVLVGLAAAAVIVLKSLFPVIISVPEYVNIAKNGENAYTFSLDSSRIRQVFCFPEDFSLPENEALDSLFLQVAENGVSYSFEVCSTVENAAALLLKGGYRLDETVFSMTAAEVSERYGALLKTAKTVSIRAFTRYYSDGNGNYSARLDTDALSKAIGDRLKSNVSLKQAVGSLSVVSSVSGTGLHVETWSVFSASEGLSLTDVLQAGGITVVDTVFDADESLIRSRGTETVSLIPYYLLSVGETGIAADIDTAALREKLPFAADSAADKAIGALGVRVTDSGSYYKLEAVSTNPDIDILTVLENNGIILTDMVVSSPKS